MKIDHVGIAVTSIDEALPFYRDQLGLRLLEREEVESQHVKVAFLGSREPGEALVELIEPLGKEGAVAKFLQVRGPGMHHLAFHTNAIEYAMERLKAHGRPPLDDRPRPGARGHKVCFLHPKHAHGVLVELVSESQGAAEHP